MKKMINNNDNKIITSLLYDASFNGSDKRRKNANIILLIIIIIITITVIAGSGTFYAKEQRKISPRTAPFDHGALVSYTDTRMTLCTRVSGRPPPPPVRLPLTRSVLR